MVDRLRGGNAMATPVTSKEVAGWFQAHSPPWPSEAHYDAIADRLNRFAAGPRTDDEMRAATDAALAAAGIRAAEPKSDTRQLWNFQKTTMAAQVLLDAIPAMRAHWGDLEWSPLTRGGTAAMDTLGAALAAAMPFVEYPFGKYPPATGQKAAKAWHGYARSILPLVLRAMLTAGHRTPGLAANSIAIAVVRRALARATGHEVPEGTIAAHLRRFPLWKGASTKEIAALCSLD
jgi:hypothetical protein